MEDSLEKAPANLENKLGTRLPNARESLEIGNVGLKFQLKMLLFMDFVNQELKHGMEQQGLLRQNYGIPHDARC